MATEEWSVLKTAIVTLLNNDSNEVLWDLQIRNLKRVCVLKHFHGCYHHRLRGHVTSWSTKKGNSYLIFIFYIFWLKEHISYWSVGVLAHWFPHLQNSQGLSAYLWIIKCTACISFIHIKHRLYNVFTVFVFNSPDEIPDSPQWSRKRKKPSRHCSPPRQSLSETTHTHTERESGQLVQQINSNATNTHMTSLFCLWKA